MVTNIVQLVFLAARQPVSEDHLDAWQAILDGLDDGPDVLDVTRHLVRQGGFVTADEVYRAVTAERRKLLALRELPAELAESDEERARRRAEGLAQLKAIRATLTAQPTRRVPVPAKRPNTARAPYTRPAVSYQRPDERYFQEADQAHHPHEEDRDRP
jgi:hypothetical protein